jgi:hypothetical protein
MDYQQVIGGKPLNFLSGYQLGVFARVVFCHENERLQLAQGDP